MQETAELFVPTLHPLSCRQQNERGNLAGTGAPVFKPPADWPLDEQAREFALPGTEPQ